MPLKNILKNKALLYKHYNLQDSTIDNWPYWMFEENIKIVNEIADDENNERKKQEEQQSKNSNMNPNSYMKSMSSMANKFKR